MPTATYEKIQTYTAASAQDTITFSSIPSTYTDLILISHIVPVNNGAAYLGIRFNDSASGYVFGGSYWTGGSSTTRGVYGGTDSQIEIIGNQFQSFGAFTVHSDIFDYISTSVYKTALTHIRTVDNTSRSLATTWTSTNAISKITIKTNIAACIGSGSMFTLYGILRA